MLSLGCAYDVRYRGKSGLMLHLKKMGGITGWTGPAALAEAASSQVSSQHFIEASAHAVAAAPNAHWIENLGKAGPLLKEPITRRCRHD